MRHLPSHRCPFLHAKNTYFRRKQLCKKKRNRRITTLLQLEGVPLFRSIAGNLDMHAVHRRSLLPDAATAAAEDVSCAAVHV